MSLWEKKLIFYILNGAREQWIKHIDEELKFKKKIVFSYIVIRELVTRTKLGHSSSAECYVPLQISITSPIFCSFLPKHLDQSETLLWYLYWLRLRMDLYVEFFPELKIPLVPDAWKDITRLLSTLGFWIYPEIVWHILNTY